MVRRKDKKLEASTDPKLVGRWPGVSNNSCSSCSDVPWALGSRSRSRRRVVVDVIVPPVVGHGCEGA